MLKRLLAHWCTMHKGVNERDNERESRVALKIYLQRTFNLFATGATQPGGFILQTLMGMSEAAYWKTSVIYAILWNPFQPHILENLQHVRQRGTLYYLIIYIMYYNHIYNHILQPQLVNSYQKYVV